jgi:hypothetical protein
LFLLLAGGLVLCAGCGLQDYEKKLAEQQELLKYGEKENDFCELRPLKLPERVVPPGQEDTSLENAELFFRPPEGILPTADEKYKGRLYVFPGRPKGGFKEMIIAAASDDRDKFVKEMLDELKFADKQKDKQEFTAIRANHPIRYDEYRLTTEKDPIRIYIVKGEHATLQFAVAFRPSAGWTSNLEEKVRWSLASLRLGTAARLQHRSYKAPDSKSSSKK